MRSLLARSRATPQVFRRALSRVPPVDRDAWVDRVLDIEGLPEDGPLLPRGCAPYLPCSVDALSCALEQTGTGPHDVFVDVGAGIGRAAMLAHLLTGASAIGLEVQPHLVRAARELSARWSAERVAVVEGDASRLTRYITIGSVFFLYCPFSGERLEGLIGDLEEIARTRAIRVCCVDLALPPCDWLAPLAAPSPRLAVYRSAEPRIR